LSACSLVIVVFSVQVVCYWKGKLHGVQAVSLPLFVHIIICIKILWNIDSDLSV